MGPGLPGDGLLLQSGFPISWRKGFTVYTVQPTGALLMSHEEGCVAFVGLRWTW